MHLILSLTFKCRQSRNLLCSLIYFSLNHSASKTPDHLKKPLNAVNTQWRAFQALSKMDGRYYAAEYFSESLRTSPSEVSIPKLNIFNQPVWPPSHEWLIHALLTPQCPKKVSQNCRVIQYIWWETDTGLNPDLMGFGETQVQTNSLWRLPCRPMKQK